MEQSLLKHATPGEGKPPRTGRFKFSTYTVHRIKTSKQNLDLHTARNQATNSFCQPQLNPSPNLDALN